MTAPKNRTANDNAERVDARTEARERDKVNALRAWRRFLSENRAGAMAAVNAAVKRMTENKVFHHAEIAQYRSQMINGVAIPDDFNHGQYGTSTRA